MATQKETYKSTMDKQASSMDRSSKIANIAVNNISTTRMTTGSNVGLFQSTRHEFHIRTRPAPISRLIQTKYIPSVKVLDLQSTAPPVTEVTTPANGLMDNLAMAPTTASPNLQNSTAPLSTSIITSIAPEGSITYSVKNETTNDYATIESFTTTRQDLRQGDMTNLNGNHKEVTHAANWSSSLRPGTSAQTVKFY